MENILICSSTLCVHIEIGNRKFSSLLHCCHYVMCVLMSMHACTQCSMMISTPIFLVRVLVTKIPWAKVTWRRKGLFPLTACPSLMEVIPGTWNQELIQRTWRSAVYWLVLHSMLNLLCYTIQDHQHNGGRLTMGWAALPQSSDCTMGWWGVFIFPVEDLSSKMTSLWRKTDQHNWSPPSELNTQTHYSSTVTFPFLFVPKISY